MTHIMSYPKSKNMFGLTALVLVLAAGATFAAITAAQKPIPVTSAAPSVEKAAPNRSVDLGAGFSFVTGAQGSRVVAPEYVAKPAPKKIDLGAGYWLELNPGEGKVIAPARPSAYSKTMDIGAGFVLELNGSSGSITRPASASSALPATSSSHAAPQFIDLGAGYRLETSMQGSRIIAPEYTAHPAVNKTDLGGGYWLVNGADGWKVIQEGK